MAVGSTPTTTRAEVPSNCYQAPPSAFVNDVGAVVVDVLTLGLARVAGWQGLGYTVINTNGQLFGLVTGDPVPAADGDWATWVIPEQPVSGYTSNVSFPASDFDKAQGRVECELCNKCAGVVGYRFPRPWDPVQMSGFHVMDDAHGSKTEIHPVLGHQIVPGSGITTGNVSGGSSRPNPHEEIFRLGISAGGTCPDYSFARVTTPSSQLHIGATHIQWPPAPPASSGVTYVAAIEIGGAEFSPAYTRQAYGSVLPFTPIFGQVDLSFGAPNRGPDGNWLRNYLRATGNQYSASAEVQLENYSAPFETNHAYYDLRTSWAPFSAHVVVDSLTDGGIVTPATGPAYRAWTLEAHVEVDAKQPQIQELFPPSQWTWYLRETGTGYSTPVTLRAQWQWIWVFVAA